MSDITPERLMKRLESVRQMMLNGTPYERANAADKFKLLLEKHDMVEADIVSEATEDYWFSYSTVMERRLLFQIYMMVCNPLTSQTSYYSRKGKREAGFVVTKIPAVDIGVFFDHWKRAMADELDVFFEAFVLKNGIVRESQENRVELSIEEQEQRERALAMAMGINATSPRTQIESEAGSQRKLF